MAFGRAVAVVVVATFGVIEVFVLMVMMMRFVVVWRMVVVRFVAMTVLVHVRLPFDYKIGCLGADTCGFPARPVCVQLPRHRYFLQKSHKTCVWEHETS